MRFFLIDRITHWEAGRTAEATKNVALSEDFFDDHFPRRPVMPGVLIIEALAQAAAILSFKTEGKKSDDKSVYYFVGIDNARFKKPVLPGDQLLLDVAISRKMRGIWKFAAIARVGSQVVTEAELMCTMRAIP